MALTIRLEPSEEKLLNKLCELTGKPSSKSLLIAAYYYINEKPQRDALFEKLRQDKAELQEQLSELKEIFQEKADIENKIQQFLNPVKTKKQSKF